MREKQSCVHTIKLRFDEMASNAGARYLYAALYIGLYFGMCCRSLVSDEYLKHSNLTHLATRRSFSCYVQALSSGLLPELSMPLSRRI